MLYRLYLCAAEESEVACVVVARILILVRAYMAALTELPPSHPDGSATAVAGSFYEV